MLQDQSVTVQIKKVDTERQLVYGEVYVPMVPDSHGDFMTYAEIEKMAHGFLRKGLVKGIDTEHSLEDNGSVVVESFVARKGDPDFIEGSWVMGVHVVDPDLWKLVKSGELNGFSMFGEGSRVKKKLTIEIPDDGLVKGETAVTAEHRHSFIVKFDESGKFVGGETSPGPDGHVHKITKGTATGEAGDDKHVHRYSIWDSVP